MHLYNSWLPPPVREQIEEEELLLGEIVASIRKSWDSADPKSKFSTLKWISPINNLIRAKTTLAKEDLDELVRLAVDIFLHSSDNLFVQVRWAGSLSWLLRKFRKTISLELDWRPFYELILTIHFKRRDHVEGAALKQIHADSLVTLVSSCRRYFKAGSTLEIWSEFSQYLKDLNHDSSLEAIGWISLFLPAQAKHPDNAVLSSSWFEECLKHWDMVPDSRYWDRQWISLLARFIKSRAFSSTIDWEPFLSRLFNRFLGMFEVPVGASDTQRPYQFDAPYEIRLMFNSGLPDPAKDVAKAIVYLLGPDNHAQQRLEKLVDLLEQYYHPSNGGSWTSSLEQLLRHLSDYFLKRMATEAKKAGAATSHFMGPGDIEAFVKCISRIISRAHYSKNKRLASTASSIAAGLAYVAPSIMLPFIVAQFKTAVITETATHQLKSALKTLALSSRPILLASLNEQPAEVGNEGSGSALSFQDCKAVLVDAMSITLLGMDANDPPKTLATLQLYSSVFSSIGIIGEACDGGTNALEIDWPQWIDEFLSRLFALLTHAESSGHSGDLNEETFLMQENSMFSMLVDLLFVRLTKPLFQLALRKVAKFVLKNILPGALSEMGLLCSALVTANPSVSVSEIVLPLMESIRTSLSDAQSPEAHLSPAAENSAAFQLGLLSSAVTNAGPALLNYKGEIKDTLSAAFRTSSVKVGEAAERLLSAVIESMLVYYVVSQFRPVQGAGEIETWFGTKTAFPPDFGPKWHIPCREEVEFSEELLRLHLQDALDELENLCNSNVTADKNTLRILLLRINGSLRGVRSCLPDFEADSGSSRKSLSLHGKAGATVGDSQMRERASDILLTASEYLLKVKSDDTSLLLSLVRSLHLVANYASSEYCEWSNGKRTWRSDARNLLEPRVNYITGVQSVGKRRPAWLTFEMVYLQNIWRASQTGYRRFEADAVPNHISRLTMQLLKLSLHNYVDVRRQAGASVQALLKRFPSLVKGCMPFLTSSLRDPEAVEHAALGACVVLSTRPVLRHIAQDWESLASFMIAVLSSSHHESIKAQTAISELAVSFCMRFGGVPLSVSFDTSGTVPSYMELVSNIKTSLSNGSGAVHWRYSLMAHVALLCLVMPSSTVKFQDQVLSTRQSFAGIFLNGVKSELPVLRPLCIIGLLLLLHSTPYKRTSDPRFSVQKAVLSELQGSSDMTTMLKTLSLDSEEAGQSNSRGHGNNLSVVNVMPFFYRGWPHTRNWRLATLGKRFSPKEGNFFKRLVQECGSTIVEAIRTPLEEAAAATEDKGLQCTAAEVVAGFLRSDVSCVAEAWDEWLGALFRKAILQTSMECMGDWSACIQFAVSSKGRRSNRAAPLRYKVLQSIADPLPESSPTSHASKRLQYFLAGLMEFRPSINADERELSLQLNLLVELMGLMTHPSPQVRHNAGELMPLICANLQAAGVKNINGQDVPDWTKVLVEGARAATLTIQKAQLLVPDAAETTTVLSAETQDAIKFMETVFHFVMSAIMSGRSGAVMPVLVGVLPSIFTLEETPNKDLSTFAKLTVYFYNWQAFRGEFRVQAVSAIVTALSDSGWRARASALSFMQSFVYRHAFLLDKESIHALWNCAQKLLSDPQLEVRELAASTLAGMQRGIDKELPQFFRDEVLETARKQRKLKNRGKADKATTNGIVMGLRACLLSAPYDVPSWLPDVLVALTKFSREPPPVSSMVSKTIAEFRRTHADTWAYQKHCFSEEQLELLSDMSSSASYFA